MIDDKIRFECYNEIALRDKAIKYQDKLYSSEKLSEKEGIKTMKKHIKNIICGICLVAMFTFAFAGSASAQTCTTLRCRLQSVITSILSGGSNIKYPSSVKPSEGTSSGSTSSSSGRASSSSDSNTGTATSAPVSNSSYAKEMLNLINQERVANGVAQLKWNEELAKVAQAKAQDMVDNNYFSHTSPTYGSPFDMMKSFGISYRYAGENIAKNSSVAKAHTALMNSEGHRKNILNSNFTSIGIGVVKTSSNSYTIVQMFIG